MGVQAIMLTDLTFKMPYHFITQQLFCFYFFNALTSNLNLKHGWRSQELRGNYLIPFQLFQTAKFFPYMANQEGNRIKLQNQVAVQTYLLFCSGHVYSLLVSEWSLATASWPRKSACPQLSITKRSRRQPGQGLWPPEVPSTRGATVLWTLYWFSSQTGHPHRSETGKRGRLRITAGASEGRKRWVCAATGTTTYQPGWCVSRRRRQKICLLEA